MRHFVFRAAPAALYYLLFILFIGFFLFSGKYNAASCKQDCCNGTAGITGFTSPVFGVVVLLPGF